MAFKRKLQKSNEVPSTDVPLLREFDGITGVSDSESESDDGEGEDAIQMQNLIADNEEHDNDENARKKLRKVPFEKINFVLFAKYIELFGNLNMRYGFTVPANSEWPEEYHGYKLGQHMFRIRSDLKRGDVNYAPEDANKLFDMGFVLDPIEETENKILYGIEHYRSLYGHVQVPNKFKIGPDNTAWPEELRGFHLGSRIGSIRKKGTYPNLFETLVDLGVDMTKKKPFHDFERIYDALVVYKGLFGNLDVPRTFEIKVGDEHFSEKAWGLKLGVSVRHITHRGAFAAEKPRLVELGLDFEAGEAFLHRAPGAVTPRPRGRPSLKVNFNSVMGALISYKMIYGNVLVPQSCVIPHDDWRYPQEAWGLELGKLVKYIRRYGKWKEHRAELEQIGINYEVERSGEGTSGTGGNFDNFYLALCAFKAINGHCKVTKVFTVPTDDPRWPESTWGMKLGSKVNDVRLRGSYKAHREALEAIGVIFEVQHRK